MTTPRIFCSDSVLRLVPALAVVLMSCSQHELDSLKAGLVTANNTITQAGDEARTGWYPDQPLLDPATVGSSNFGRRWKTQLEPGFSQRVMGQPLVVGGQVLVVTEANNLYLVDARTGSVTTSRSLGLGFDAQPLGCGDTVPTIGITGTPVVDVTTNTAYFYSKSSAGDYTLHAVDAADLTERGGFPVTISGFADNDPTAQFNSLYALQRTGLLLMNGVVYAGFGSLCDVGPFRGWIIGVTTTGVIHTQFTTAPNLPGATHGNGIWMSGAGLMSDAPGQIVFATSNGYDGDPWSRPIPGNTPPTDLENAVVRVVVQPDGSLKATDFFAAYDASSLSGANQEVGAGGVVALPSQFGTSAIPHVMVAGGKDAVLYFLNRDNLGGFEQGANGSDGSLASIPLGGSSFSRPGVWPGEGGYVYVMVNGGTSTTGFKLQAYKFGSDANGKPVLTLAGITTDDFGAYSGTPIVTSNGTNPGSALVWATNLTAEFRVYDAVPVNGVLNVRFRDGYGGEEAKFTTPGVGAGMVYLGTGDGYLVGYGASAPSVSGSPLAFGPVNVGQAKTLTATITANLSVTINALSSSNPAFVLGSPSAPLPAALTAGQSISVPVRFSPTGVTSYTASLNVTTSSAPGALTMSGSGQAVGPYLAISPNPLNFGGVVTGTSRSLALSLTNIGTSTLTFSGVTAPTGPFSVTSGPASPTLAPGTSTTLTVRFAPTVAGSYSSSLAVSSNGGTVTVSLAGLAGTPPNLVVTPLNNDFGTVAVGSSKTSTFTLQNTGGLDLTISLSKAPVLGQFVARSSLLEGSTIPAGQTVTEKVQFSSSETGFISDVWQIAGNDSTGLHSVTFTANSVAALPSGGWVATASATGGGDVPARAIDSAGTSTRWSTGLAQSGAATQSFTLDMLSPQTFSMISMDSDADYVRAWELYASDSPTSWGTPIATGTSTANPVVITFPTQTHRYLQIRQLPSAGTGSWWSIYDLKINGITAPVWGPHLRASPNPLDFGGIATGTSKSLGLSLTNIGSGTLTFSGITAPTGPFFVSGAPANGATLAVGASIPLTVTFQPQANGTYSSSLAVGSNGGTVNVSLTGHSGAPPNLVVTPLVNDFGTVVVGAPKTLSFTLQNTGGSDLTISTSNPPALGSFIAQTSLPVGSTIAAGQTVTETVEFASTATGVMSDAWQIAGNDSTGLHSVTFRANSVAVLPRTGWVATASSTAGGDVPAQAIDAAGTSTRWSSGLAQSSTTTQSFTLDLGSRQTFGMIRMDSGGDYARAWEVYASDSTTSWGTAIATGTATADPVLITFPMQTHRYLQIRQRPSAGTGSWWSIYNLNLYGITGPVSGPQLQVVPNPLDFGGIANGTSKSLDLSLRNIGSSTLTFSGISTLAAPFSVSGAPANGATLVPGASTTVTVTFAPAAIGLYSSSLAVGSDGGTVTVSLSGLSGAAPTLVVAPLANDFGTVAAGTSRTLSFELQNTGGGDLTITTSTPPALGAFVAQTSLPAGTTIAPGQTVIESVHFASTATGTLSDVWQIAANDATGLHSVTFRANSVAALPRTGWVATASSTAGTDVPARAIDAAGTSTRWSTGQAQSGAATQSFTVDLQTAQTFNQITMDSGGDYVRSDQVFVSADGVNWGSAVATGGATASPVIVNFATQTARFIQVRQLPSAGTTSWWSIYDFNVIAGATAPKPALLRTGWAASASATSGTDVPANAIDNSTATRWSTGLGQSGGATQSFTLDMQAPQTFSQLTMVSDGDYARNWLVYLSSDGTNWGTPEAMATAAMSPITVFFASTTARYIQIRQAPSAGTTSWWSIYDLNVYGP